MTLSIAMVLAILFVALALFVAEWMRMDLVALVVLSALGLGRVKTSWLGRYFE